MNEMDEKYLEELKKLKQSREEDPNIPKELIDFLQTLVDQVNKNWEDVQKLLKEKKD